MRPWLTLFTLAILALLPSRAQQPFPDGAPVQFSFHETLEDKVVPEPGSDPADESFLVGTERTLLIQGSAPLNGFDLSQLTDSSTYDISVGDFDTDQIQGLEGKLSDDDSFDPATDKSIAVSIPGFTYDGEEVEIGTVGISWTATKVSFTVSIGTVNQPLTSMDEEVATEFYREKDEVIDGEDLTAGFGFGPFSYNLRTVYTTGVAAIQPADPRVPDILSKVVIDGAIDYLAPAVAITDPAPNSDTSDEKYTIKGTVSDKREIKRLNDTTLVFDGEIDSVEVRVGTRVDPGEFIPATVNGSTWELPDAVVQPGDNFITARATDIHGNVTTTTARKFSVQVSGPITVEAAAANFPGGASGVAGTVSGAFFTGASKQITATIGQPKQSNTRTGVNSGQFFSVTAVPAPGAVFNGWTATLNGNPYFTAVPETLTFETRPKLVLHAEFIPNPFTSLLGVYQGLITGDDVSERGIFSVSIGKTGAFTGKSQVGALVLPIKGKVLGSGFWQGKVKRGGKEYVVSFNLNVSANGDQQLTGTVTGGGLSAEITADLKTWRKARKNVAGHLATAYAGIYTALLTPPNGATSGVPLGTGFGRASISSLGVVTFLGKLGDGTPVKASSTLVERVSGPVVFPLFIPLDKKQGNVSGYVTYEAAAESDLTASLDWTEPTSKKVDPQAFAETIALTGARYTKPAPGGFAMLTAENGEGFAGLVLPDYSVPVTPAGQFMQVKSAAVLHPLTGDVTLTDPAIALALSFRMKINAGTGLFSGTFKDPQLNRAIPFAGAVVQKANSGSGLAGGVLVRGNRTGSIYFGPTPAP
jgi:hypothetical protein